MTKITSVEERVAEFDIRKVLPFTLSYAQRHPNEMETTVADKINADVNYAITQARTALLTELTQTIQAIDFYGWNEQTQSRIKEKVQAHINNLINPTV